MLLLAQFVESGIVDLVKAVGLAGALVVIVVVWLTRSFVPRLQDDNEKARTQFTLENREARREFLEENRQSRKEYLESVQKLHDAHERSIDKVVSAVDRQRSENINQHREFDSRLDDLEREADARKEG